jgi:septum formation protein
MNSGQQSFALILGSSSRSRQQLLKELGYEFQVLKPNINEEAIRHPDAEQLVRLLGNAKADALLTYLEERRKAGEEAVTKKPLLLITGDQVVVHQGRILEKPQDASEARRFISSYGTAPAVTVGSIVVTNVFTKKRYEAVDRAEIYFHPIPESVIEKLIAEGDVFACSGGLMVEHPLVNKFVHHIVGSIDSVMGLNKSLTRSLVERALLDGRSACVKTA